MATKKADIKSAPVKWFPNDLMSDAYEQRRLYITIYESDTLDNIVPLLEEAWDATKKNVDEALKGDGSVVDKSTKLIKSTCNIMGNIQKFNGVEKMTIALPMPNELADLQRHEFSVDTGIAKAIFDLVPGSSLMQKYVSKVAQVGNKQTIIANPGYFQNYTGSKPRDFSFTFNLILNNRAEADNIIDIINNINE